MAPLIRDLAVILAVAGIVTLIFQRIRQPVVLGYIVAGMLVGPHLGKNLPFIPQVTDLPNIHTWAEIGVIVLMFSLGLEFSFKKLSRVGISASLTALFEMTGMWALGYGLGRYFGWNPTQSIFLGAMLAVASTTIILKSLEELRLKTRRFSEHIFGILVVEDLVAILILVALSSLGAAGGVSGLTLMRSGFQLLLVLTGWFVLGYFLVPRAIRYVGRLASEELLTILALGFCFALAVSASKLGYSPALGAFIMGSILAESTESFRIEEAIKPLRNVFGAIFFVSVGMLMELEPIIEHWDWILILAASLIIAKTKLVTLGALLTGQTLRTSIQVGMGLANIGEFSFIIAGLGLSLHLTHPDLYPIAVSVSILTAFTTPYFIRSSNRFAKWFEARLPITVSHGLTRYAALTQERRSRHANRAEFYRLLMRWLLSGLLLTLAFVVSGELIKPWVIGHGWSESNANLAAWCAALLIGAPFFWSMFSAFRSFSFESTEASKAPHELHARKPTFGTALITRLLTLIWLGGLTYGFLPGRPALLVIAALFAVFFAVFFKTLGASYRWLERQFLTAFEPAPKTRRRTDVLRQLAPWDAHLVRIKVHPNAEIAGKKISEAALRSRHNINVIAIQRGLKTIVAPRAADMIFPKDELLVLGTDEEIEATRLKIENPPGLETRFEPLSGYELREIEITANSRFLGLAIRDTQLRDEYGAIVVGLERGEQRMLNPDIQLELVLGDRLWIAGEVEQLKRLVESLVSNKAGS